MVGINCLSSCLQLAHPFYRWGDRARDRLPRVVGEYLPGWHTYEDYRTMYASRRSLGGRGSAVANSRARLSVLVFGGRSKSWDGRTLQRTSKSMLKTIASTLLRYDGWSLICTRLISSNHQPGSLKSSAARGKSLSDLRASSVTAYGSAGEIIESQVYPDLPRNSYFSTN